MKNSTPRNRRVSLYEISQQELIEYGMYHLDLDLVDFAARIGSKPATVSKWLRQPDEVSNYREMPGTVRQQIIDLLALVSLQRKHERLKVRFAELQLKGRANATE